MKRPLVVIAAGFVLGEVLALQQQEAFRQWLMGSGILLALLGIVWIFLSGSLRKRGRKRRESRSVDRRALLLVFFVFVCQYGRGRHKGRSGEGAFGSGGDGGKCL